MTIVSDNLDYQLFMAAFDNKKEELVDALNKDAKVNSVHTYMNFTALHAAAKFNYQEIFSELMSQKDIDIDCRNTEGATPLYIAVLNGNINITKSLLEAGANTEIAVSSGHNALYAAVQRADIEIVKLLLEYGAKVISNDLYYTSLMQANFLSPLGYKYKEIAKLIMDTYAKKRADILSNIDKKILNNTNLSLEVVVVRYDEDLSWIEQEFLNSSAKIVIYNKGEDNLDYLPKNYTIINTPNVGWFGGTILLHIVNNYDNLADRTLFLQGFPYDQELLLPLIIHNDETLQSQQCINIIGKCQNTTLLKESEEFHGYSDAAWKANKYKLFERDNSSMIMFSYNYIDAAYQAADELRMDLGAQFAVDREKVRFRSKNHYQRMLDVFNKTRPIADFYLEKTWDVLLGGYNHNPKCYKVDIAGYDLAYRQENIDINTANDVIKLDAYYKLHAMQNAKKPAATKMPLISHQIFLSNSKCSTTIDPVSLKQTLLSIDRLNSVAQGWKHIIWTNCPASINDEALIMPNVELRNIKNPEYQITKDALYPTLLDLINQELYSPASDIIRYIAVKLYGGLYRDLDLEIYEANKFLELMKTFHFFAGREHGNKLSAVGSAVFAAVPEHPVISKAHYIIVRNVGLIQEQLLPEYISRPCNLFAKIMHQFGPFVITIASYQALNTDGYYDVIMPDNVLFNANLAHYVTSESRCSSDMFASPLAQVFDMQIKTYSADMACGNWYNSKNNKLFLPITYDAPQQKNLEKVKNKEDKLIDLVKFYLQNKMDINQAVHNRMPLLSLAIYQGNIEAVKLLLENKAKLYYNDNQYFNFFQILAAEHLLIPNKQVISELLMQEYWKQVEEFKNEVARVKTNYSYEFVISVYNEEDLSWVNKELANQKVTIYNKGDNDLSYFKDSFQVIKLANIGRETQSYLHHIITNYNNLPDRLIFFQGHPHEHFVYLPLLEYAFSNNTSCSNVINKCTAVTLGHLSAELSNLDWKSTKWHDIVLSNETLLEFAQNHVNSQVTADTMIKLQWGGQFAALKENILCHDIEYYQQLNATLAHKHPIEVHYLERMWDLVFNCNTNFDLLSL
jgi:ankyrin repeat protein